jgi:hypothetical protein
MGPWPTMVYLTTATVTFAALAWLGGRVDGIRLDYLAGRTSDMEGVTGAGRLNQLYLSVAFAFSMAGLFAILGM